MPCLLQAIPPSLLSRHSCNKHIGTLGPMPLRSPIKFFASAKALLIALMPASVYLTIVDLYAVRQSHLCTWSFSGFPFSRSPTALFLFQSNLISSDCLPLFLYSSPTYAAPYFCFLHLFLCGHIWTSTPCPPLSASCFIISQVNLCLSVSILPFLL